LGSVPKHKLLESSDRTLVFMEDREDKQESMWFDPFSQASTIRVGPQSLIIAIYKIPLLKIVHVLMNCWSSSIPLKKPF